MMKTTNHGTHIGSTITGTMACANNIILTAWSETEMMNFFANQDRLKIHPVKTCVSVFSITQTEMVHLQTAKIWNINKESVPVGREFTHLGINFNLTSYNAHATTTVDTRLTLSRNTAYALMSAGFHGMNGINHTTSIHIYNVYILSRVLYRLEAISRNPTNLQMSSSGPR